ncbi:hypothetical protein V6N13_098165 [Hibiscus sabdariffa]|uniref:Uncharacterized protein n=1 Tax=Hibiscus sabdariffa TaxID=183260 RepID=A0ABR2EEP7_9ROSI
MNLNHRLYALAFTNNLRGQHGRDKITVKEKKKKQARSVCVARCNRTSAALTVGASSYADELVKTAVTDSWGALFF